MTEDRRCGVPLNLTVRFAETDQMGVVHHSVYAIWMEAGRVAWMDAAGIPYADVAAQGYNLAVTGLTIEYRKPIHFGDDVRIITKLSSLRSRQVSFGYEIVVVGDSDNDNDHIELCATGRSDHICVDEDGGMARIPPHVLQHMNSYTDA